MPVYKVKIKEICEKVVKIQARDEVEVYVKAQEMYQVGDLMDITDGATCQVEYQLIKNHE